MSRVLVTGSTGFTGSHLARRLAESGHSVVAFVRRGSDTAELERQDIECRTVDLAEPESLAPQFYGVDVVFHVAAAFRTEHADPTYFHRVNVEGTGHLLRLAEERGVDRFVHCSTVGVQGRIDDPPATEAYRCRPGDPYQETKLEGEKLARQAMEVGLPVSIVRPVGIYGPGDTRFLKLFRAIARRRFVMIGSGETLYHMTYIDDLVDGLLLAGHHPDAVGEIFTIGGDRYSTLNELVRQIAGVLGVPAPRWRIPYAPVYAGAVVCSKLFRLFGMAPPLYPRRVEFFALDRAFDISKARELLGYEPKVSLEEGLRRTADWYRSVGLL